MGELQWHIGCSGFYYKEWKEVFYPKGWPQKKWFEYYCNHFNTLEINNSFYRFPELSTLQSWYNRSPDNFLFAVKATRTITHIKPFIDTQNIIEDFYGVVKDGFGNKLGPILFQLPPHLAFSEEALERIVSQLNPSFLNVIEFRHKSWWREDVYAFLKQKKIVFSGISYPDLPNDVISNGNTAYYRFHGLPKLYFSDYDPAFLREVVLLIQEDTLVKKAFLYFNNTAAAAALDNARFVQEFIQSNAEKYYKTP
ncbi:MAG TPA: DUF72 domain-containing protein [Flavisolibacter sp.]|nr:DUF72 domain-containing protein [Flavisolibacter sp.]